MKKTLFFVGLLGAIYANAQQIQNTRSIMTTEKLNGRLGVNTNVPVATLEIAKVNSPYPNQVEGFMLPHLTQTERNNMKKEELTNGLQIFNIDKNCIDWWNGSTWQCTDGSLQDKHGDAASFIETAYYPEAGESTQIFYKNNCPAGQQPKEGISFTGRGQGRGVAAQRQTAIDKAKESAYRNFLRLGQDNANLHGLCEPAPAVPQVDPIVIADTQLQIGNTKFWFSSIGDNDYLDAGGNLIMPTTPASWQDQAPAGDGVKEAKAIEVQGIIPMINEQRDNYLEVAVPILVGPSTTLNLPGFTSYLEVPSEYTQDGKRGIIVFTWEPTTLNTTTKYFMANIYAKAGTNDIKLKQLDMAKGLGSDLMGLSLGTIRYPKNASDNDPATWQGEINIRLISGIPDRRFNMETTIERDTQKRHQFLYVPAIGPDGNIWLSNNLGANYANIHSPVFSPAQQAKTFNDKNAYGSLFQWGRAGDGHELMDWENNKPVFTQEPFNWLSDKSGTLTQFNENCPQGFHTPTFSEFTTLSNSVNAYTLNMKEVGFRVGGLRAPLMGFRMPHHGSTLDKQGIYSYFWSSTPTLIPIIYWKYDDYQSAAYFGNTLLAAEYGHKSLRGHGLAIRCLKDNN